MGDTDTSISITLSEAKTGNAIAQARLGKWYYLGHGVPRDFEQAAKWLRLAADQKNSSALNNLGLMYLAGKGVKPNQTEGIRLLRMASDLGLDVAQYNLGASYRAGSDGLEGNVIEWLRLTHLAAKQGYAPALFDLGTFYAGEGKQKEAAQLFLQAAAEGDMQSQSTLGFMYEYGRGVAVDMTIAAKWARLAADQGDMQSQIRLGNLHATGEGVQQSYSEAMKWYRAGTVNGCIVGCSNMGLLYALGQGVQKNSVLAYALLTFYDDAKFETLMRDTSASLDAAMSCDDFVSAKKLAAELGRGPGVPSKIDRFLTHPFTEKYQGKSPQTGLGAASERCR